MFPRDWKHFKKLLIKINIVLVIHATMNSGKNNLNCEAFCSACANISSSNQRASLGALRKTIRFYIVNLFERLNEYSTLCFASHDHLKSSTNVRHIFYALFGVWYVIKHFLLCLVYDLKAFKVIIGELC